MAEKENCRNDAEVEEEEPTICCMTKELIPCKMLFFVIDASFSSLFSFLGLFYLSSGLTVTQLGLINGIGSGFSLIAHPIWGALVDSAMKHRTLLFVSLSLGTTVLEFGKPWLIMFVSKSQTIVKCLGNTTVIHSALFNAGNNCTTHVRLLNPDQVFYAAAINGILSSVVIAGLMTYLEGAVIKTVFTRKTEHSYGEQKVFGPIGMAIGSFAAGVAVDHYKPKNMSPYLAAFYIYLPLSLLQIPLLYILTQQAVWEPSGEKKGEKKEEKKSALMKHVMKSLRNGDTLMFLVSVFISGLAVRLYGHFLFIYMYQVMNPSKTIMSLMSVASSVSELFIYPFSSKLIKLFGGHMRCIITGMLLYSLRLVVLSYVRTPWAVLPLALMAGVAASLSWTAMIEKTWMIFPKEITNTAIGILVTFHATSPGIIANVLGGVLYHKFGGAHLFRAMAIINGVWCLVMICYFELRNKTSAKCDKDFPVTNGYSQNIEIELEEGHVE